MTGRQRIAKLTIDERVEAVQFVRLLASYECAGSPGCEPVAVDVATGKQDGGLCGPCEASNWLRVRGLR